MGLENTTHYDQVAGNIEESKKKEMQPKPKEKKEKKEKMKMKTPNKPTEKELLTKAREEEERKAQAKDQADARQLIESLNANPTGGFIQIESLNTDPIGEFSQSISNIIDNNSIDGTITQYQANELVTLFNNNIASGSISEAKISNETQRDNGTFHRNNKNEFISLQCISVLGRMFTTKIVGKETNALDFVIQNLQESSTKEYLKTFSSTEKAKQITEAENRNTVETMTTEKKEEARKKELKEKLEKLIKQSKN